MTREEIEKAIQEIDIAALKRKGSKSGLYGFYVHQGAIGVKCQEDSRNAEGEYGYLNMLADSGLTPVPYDLRTVHVGDKRYYAIFMEHVEGKTLRASADPEELAREEKRINQEANEKLAEYGIRHGDLHYENILIRPDGSYRVIDFTPGYIHPAGSKAGYWPEGSSDSDSDSDSDSEWEPMDSPSPSADFESIPDTRSDQLTFDFVKPLGRRHARRVRFAVLAWLDDCIVDRQTFNNRQAAMEELEYQTEHQFKFGRIFHRYELVSFTA